MNSPVGHSPIALFGSYADPDLLGELYLHGFDGGLR